MTGQKENFKAFYQKGDAGFWSLRKRSDEVPTKSETQGDTVYKASFRYENFKTQIELNAKKDADYADWKNYIEQCERAKRNIDTQNKSAQDKERERDQIDNQSVDLNQGVYNQILNKIKAIDLNIQKTIPEKMKDMREIMQEVESKNKEMTEALDKKMNQLQEAKINLAEQARKAIENNDNKLTAIINIKMKEIEGKIAQMADEKDKYSDNKWVKDYLEGQEAERNKWFWEKMNWQESRTYWILSVHFFIFFSIIFLIIWVVNKIKSLNSK